MEPSNRQKATSFANTMLLIPNHAIFIQTNTKKENLKNKKQIDAGGKHDACVLLH